MIHVIPKICPEAEKAVHDHRRRLVIIPILSRRQRMCKIWHRTGTSGRALGIHRKS